MPSSRTIAPKPLSGMVTAAERCRSRPENRVKRLPTSCVASAHHAIARHRNCGVARPTPCPYLGRSRSLIRRRHGSDKLRDGRCNPSLIANIGPNRLIHSFAQRPEIKAPVLDIHTWNKSSVAPGFIFVAPYASIYQQKPATGYYEPCQTGPHIYDANGVRELVDPG